MVFGKGPKSIVEEIIMSPDLITTLPLQLQTSFFWIGIYGLIQVVLWARLVTIRAPQPTWTNGLQALAASKDVRGLCATRTYGNYIESAPMVSLLLMVIDGSDVVPKLYVDVLGGVFTFGRLFHMIGLWSNEGATVGRLTGGLLSLSSLMVGSCMALYSTVQPLIQTEDGLSRMKIIFTSIALMVVSAKMFAAKVVA